MFFEYLSIRLKLINESQFKLNPIIPDEILKYINGWSKNKDSRTLIYPLNRSD